MSKFLKIPLLSGLSIAILFFFTIAVYCQPQKLIDLDFKNTDIKDVLRALAAQNGSNFLIDNEVSGNITIHLTKVNFENALNIITRSNHLQCTKENNIYKIVPTDDSVLNITYADNLLSLEAKNVKTISLIQKIAEKTELNLVPNPDLNERITINLHRISLQNGLDSILRQANCIAEKNGEVTFIRKNASPQQPFTISYQNNLLTVDAQNVPLTSLTRAITEKTGVSVVPNKDLNLNINIYFQNLPLVDALTLLCNSNNLQLNDSGEAWMITRGTTTGSAGQNININYDSKQGLFNIEIQSAPLTAVINEMTRKANLDLIILMQANWTVNNIRLHKLTFEQTLAYLLKGTTFTYKLENGIYMIGDGLTVRPENSCFTVVKVYPIKYLKADVLLSTLPAIFSKQNFALLSDKNALLVTAPDSVHQLFSDYLKQVDIDDNQDRTVVIKIKYLKAEDVLKYMPSSISKTDLVVVKETNSITVTGPQNLINQVQQYISKIDQVNPMIVFDVRVILINNDTNFNWSPSYTVDIGGGTKLSLDTESGTLSTSSTSSSLISLELLLQKNMAKIIQNPTITTLNGYAASFSVSTKRTYSISETTVVSGVTTTTTSTKTLDSGLSLTITPWVADNKITMEIKPKISEYGAVPSGQTLPETTEHATETTVKVSDKQAVIIGGLKNTRKEKTVYKIPILGSIPLLGYLFSSVSTKDVSEEFVIVITPHLVYDETDESEVVKKINDNMSPDLQNSLKSETNQTGLQKKNKK